MSINPLMRPSPLLLATVAIWLLSWFIWTLDAAALGMTHQVEISFRGALCDSTGILMCGLMYLVLRAIEDRPPLLRFAVALAMAVVATVAFMAVIFVGYYVILPMTTPSDHWVANHADTCVAILWTFLAWCGVYFALRIGAQLQEKETCLREAEALAVDAQNRMLRYQLDPHFLFNIHSALATLIHDGRNEDAEKMVLALSTFLRRSLDKDPVAMAPLSDELDAVREYLNIESIRFGDRLNVIETVSGGAEAAPAPSFILQPLVENAIKHGLGRSARPVTVEIGACRENGALRLWIEDNGEGGPSNGSAPTLGVGLENVRRRLHALYGGAAAITAEHLLPRGYKVTLSIPLEAT